MIEEALAFAVVDIGLSPEAFARLTTDEWDAIAQRKADAVQIEYRENWERVRTLVYAALAPHLKAGVTLTDVMPLPWDVAKERNELPTKEERAEMLRRYS